MSIRRLNVKEMYRIHSECGGKVIDDKREVITREELQERVLDKIAVGDFDELEVRIGLVRTKVRRF